MAFPIFAKLSFSAQGVKEGLDSASNSFGRLKNQVSAANQKLAAIGGGLRAGGLAMAPLTAGMGLATTSFMNFEKQMSIVRSLTGKLSNETFAKMQAEAKRLGSITSFSAVQAGEGFQFLALAGFTAEEQIGSLEPVLRLAEAGSLDLGRASDIATDSQSSLGLAMDQTKGKAANLAEIVDKMAFIQSKTNTNVEQLGEAIKYGGGALAGFGIPLNEILVALGSLANAGLKGSMGGTSLMNMFNHLVKPSDKANKILKELNVTLLDANGAFLPLPQVTENLVAGLNKIKSPTKRAEAAVELFGLRGIRAFNALQNQGGKSMEILMEGVAGSMGEAMRQSQERLNNLYGGFVRLKSATEGVLIEIGAQIADFLKEPIESVANNLGGIAQAFQIATGQIDRTSDTAKKFFEQFGDKKGNEMISFVTGFIEGFKEVAVSVKETINTVVGFFKGFSESTGMTTQDIGKLVAKIITIGAIAAPIIGGIGLALFVLTPIISGIAAAFGLVGSVIGVAFTVFTTVFPVVMGLLGSLIATVGIIPLAIIGIAVAAYIFRDKLIAAFTAVKDFVVNVFTKAMNSNLTLLLGPIGLLIRGLGVIKNNFGAIKSFLGFGDVPLVGPPTGATQQPTPGTITGLADEANAAGTRKSALVAPSPVPVQAQTSDGGQSASQNVTVESKLVVDGEVLARATSRREVEMAERRGVQLSPGEKRMRLQKGATATKGEF